MNIKFKSQGINLVGKVTYPKATRSKMPAILFIHGWISNMNKEVRYAKKISNLGFVCLNFDLGGHGKSGGDINKFSRKDYVQEVVDAYDYLVTLPKVNSDKIIVIGSSFGCYMACILTAKRDVKALVLRVPQNYPDKEYASPKVLFPDNVLKEWRFKKLKEDATKSLRALSKFRGKVLILESEYDPYIPQQTYMNYKNAAKKSNLNYIVMKGFHHSLQSREEQDGYVEELVSWLKYFRQ